MKALRFTNITVNNMGTYSINISSPNNFRVFGCYCLIMYLLLCAFSAECQSQTMVLETDRTFQLGPWLDSKPIAAKYPYDKRFYTTTNIKTIPSVKAIYFRNLIVDQSILDSISDFNSLESISIRKSKLTNEELLALTTQCVNIVNFKIAVESIDNKTIEAIAKLNNLEQLEIVSENKSIIDYNVLFSSKAHTITIRNVNNKPINRLIGNMATETRYLSTDSDDTIGYIKDNVSLFSELSELTIYTSSEIEASANLLEQLLPKCRVHVIRPVQKTRSE